jgi:hypothetical protein
MSRRRRHPHYHANAVHQQTRDVREEREDSQHKQRLFEKMGYKVGYSMCLINPPAGAYTRFSNDLPDGSHLYLGMPPRGQAHLFVLWPDGVQTLQSTLSYLKAMLDPEGAIWVVLPRKRAVREGDDVNVSLQELKQVVERVGMTDDQQISFSGSHYAIRVASGSQDRRGRRGN